MANAEELPQSERKNRGILPRRKRWRFLLVVLLLLLIVSSLTWRSREQIAENLIEGQLAQLGIDASYEIESITPTRQVLRNFVIGDKTRPDLSVERIELVPRVGLTGPAIGTLKLVRPRLRASVKDGELSLGALDALLESDSEESTSLPGWSLELVDGRARIFTDWGVIGVDAQGQGKLDDGFVGNLAAVASDLSVSDCQLQAPELVGKVTVINGRPGFAGPLNLNALNCDGVGMRLTEATIDARVTGDRDLQGLSGEIELSTGELRGAGVATSGLSGSSQIGWSDGIANAKFALSADDLSTAGADLAGLSMKGAARFRPSDGRVEFEADVDGRDVSLASATQANLSQIARASSGTLAEPLIAKLSGALNRQLPNSALRANVLFRQTDERWSLVIPSARLRSASGDELFAASQLQFGVGADGEMQLAGNLTASGEGLPALRGRLEASAEGGPSLRIDMAPYRSGASEVEIPQLTLTRLRSGDLAMSGTSIATGEIPGGRVSALQIPLQGTWSDRAGLTLMRNCGLVRFAQLELSGLALDRNSLRVCPLDNFAVVRSGSAGVEVSASINDMALSGELGESPISIEANEVRFTSAEGLFVDKADVVLGSDDEQNRFALAGFNANFTETPSGTMSGIEAGLAAVPLDIVAGESAWAFEEGVFSLSDANFRVRDRDESQRFYPLAARGATLTLQDNVITANAVLRRPGSSRTIVEVALHHNLDRGAGYSDINVPGAVFDERLQLDQLTILADGVVELAEGTITGSGRIDWDGEEVTSHGAFSSDGFDFAAAFGPVAGVSGTVTFSDLLSLTTDGTQSLKIGSINPGVEVFDGIFDFALVDGTRVSIKGGRWPFFGGTMVLRPTEIDLARVEERNYVIEVTGADAAQFVTAMEMGNLSVTGTFDGAVPLLFDEMGNGEIVNGLLISRPPGGNVSYIGELTYEDAGAIANFAFDSLRSLDFSQMSVEMNGPLSGEIITRLLFDGISQGAGADRNFVTRQIAKLPIRFNVNIRASFYQLLMDLRGMYDPAFIRDPRSVGLVRTQSGQLIRQSVPDQPATEPQETLPDESSIQTDESETLP